MKYIMSASQIPPRFQLGDVQEYIKPMSTYLFPIVMLIIIVAIIIKITRDKDSLSQKYYLYTFIIIVPIILLGLYVNDGFSKFSVAIKQFISIGIFIFACIAVWMYYYQTNATSVALNYTMFIVFFLLMLTTLSIIYTVFMQYVKNINKWSGFFIELIFTLPCYFIDFIQYIVQDARSTPPTLLILFVLEIVFLLCYQYLPKYFNRFTHDKTVLVKEPVPLNKEYVAVDSEHNEIFKMGNVIPGTIDSSNTTNVNYSISFWYYLNPENSGGVEKNLFYLATEDGSMNPQVVYKNNGTNVDMIEVRVTSYLGGHSTLKSETIMQNNDENTAGGQKWNHLVITYDNQKCDIWLNGVLEKTISDVHLSASKIMNKLVLGQEGGKYGFIKNVRYTSYPMTKPEIIKEYNLEKGL